MPDIWNQRQSDAPAKDALECLPTLSELPATL
jgi:hypothetical protein